MVKIRMWCYERRKKERKKEERKKEKSRDQNSPKAFGELIRGNFLMFAMNV